MFIPEDIYKDIIQHTVVPTADIIFLDANKNVLLWLRNNEPLKWLYHLPGGRIQKNETLLEATKRKAKEEVNIDIDIHKLHFVWVYDDIFNTSIYTWLSAHCLASTFVYPLNQWEQEHISPNNQHNEFSFFAYDDSTLHPFLSKRSQDIESNYHIFNC